jgi:hypothetical protein
MHLVKYLSLGVVGFKIGILNTPLGRNPSLQGNRLKIPLPQPLKNRPINFGITAQGIFRLGSKGFASLVVPVFGGMVALLLKNIDGINILIHQGHGLSPFQH